ncbi:MULTISPECIES: hypothetical protein [Peribacillus]|uniref:hypothetical protein n=1 Tax=Peribacillus TaxID=2675229 RepID=UPI001F4D5A40|nr:MULTISPECIES: hypothetical protein [unclassified Peribacillus]MCK1982227.1 hypothetical protein [Peribacillus sp. Aquil_B1]MCK2007421.1 hypothetical protein [Peribacillus sp. Aquil_B8]
MAFIEIDEYLHKLHYTKHYTDLPVDLREKIAFTAEEMLKNHFDETLLSDKIIALQTIYMIEGEDEEFAKFKRQGVKSMKVDEISFSFDTGNISPEVISIIAKVTETTKSSTRAYVGRLI